MKHDSKWSTFKLNVIEFFGKRGIVFGAYTKDERGNPDFYPYFAWDKRFKCIPLLFGNLYLTPSKRVKA